MSQSIRKKQQHLFIYISLASYLWDIVEEYSLRCDAAGHGIPSWAVLFVKRNFIKKLNEILKSLLVPLKSLLVPRKWTCPNTNNGKVHRHNWVTLCTLHLLTFCNCLCGLEVSVVLR